MALSEIKGTASSIGVMALSESFIETLIAGEQKASFSGGQSFSGALPIQALRGLSCLWSFDVWHVRHSKGHPVWGPTV